VDLGSPQEARTDGWIVIFSLVRDSTSFRQFRGIRASCDFFFYSLSHSPVLPIRLEALCPIAALGTTRIAHAESLASFAWTVDYLTLVLLNVGTAQGDAPLRVCPRFRRFSEIRL